MIVFAVVMVWALGVTGCKEKTSSETVSGAAESVGQATGDTARAAGTAVENAAEVTGEFLTHSKDTSVKVAQERLNGIEKKWQELQRRAVPATDAAKADFQKAKDQMAETLAEAKAKLGEAKDASADVWQQNIKPELNAALQKAQKLYADTSAKFGSN